MGLQALQGLPFSARQGNVLALLGHGQDTQLLAASESVQQQSEWKLEQYGVATALRILVRKIVGARWSIRSVPALRGMVCRGASAAGTAGPAALGPAAGPAAGPAEGPALGPAVEGPAGPTSTTPHSGRTM